MSVGETEFVKLCQNGKEAAGRTEGNNVKKRMFQEKKKTPLDRRFRTVPVLP